MREERNGLDDTLSVASTSASVVKGAVKTGKAIAAATKGASVGGPYGAVAGAVWGARKHLGTIAIVLVVILLLPVLFIVMLPSIIFWQFVRRRHRWDYRAHHERQCRHY